MGNFGKAALFLGALGVAGYAIFVYLMLPLGEVLHPDMRASFQQHATGIYIHIFSAVVALLLGPLQFSTTLRRRWPRMHRWAGRIYLGIGVLVGGLSGLYVAQFAYGGTMARLGFSLLAIAWLYTGLRGLLSIVGRDIQAHRKWMIFNFALTCAAVTLRIYIPLAMVTGIEFAAAYPLIAWLCWVPNLLVAALLVAPVQHSEPAVPDARQTDRSASV